MLKFPSKLAERLDQWTDGWNPVLVRELRTLVRRRYFLYAAICYFLVAPPAFFYLIFHPPAVHDMPEGMPPDVFPGFILAWITGYFVLALTLYPAAQLVHVQFKDDMLNLTGMTPRSVFWGYVQLCVVTAGFFPGCTLIVLVIWGCLFGVCILIPLMVLLPVFTVGAALSLVAFSAAVKVKTGSQLAVLLLTAFVLFFLFVLNVPTVVSVAENIEGRMKHLDDFTFNVMLNATFVFGMILLGVAAYESALHHFEQRRESFYKALTKNVIAYCGAVLLMDIVFLLLVFAYPR